MKIPNHHRRFNYTRNDYLQIYTSKSCPQQTAPDRGGRPDLGVPPQNQTRTQNTKPIMADLRKPARLEPACARYMHLTYLVIFRFPSTLTDYQKMVGMRRPSKPATTTAPRWPRPTRPPSRRSNPASKNLSPSTTTCGKLNHPTLSSPSRSRPPLPLSAQPQLPCLSRTRIPTGLS